MLSRIFKYKILSGEYKEMLFLIMFYFLLATLALAYVAHSEKSKCDTCIIKE